MIERRELNHFLRYQSLYAFIVYLVVTWTMFSSRISALESQMIKEQTRNDNNQILLVDVQSRLASIETSIEFIKQAVSNR